MSTSRGLAVPHDALKVNSLKTNLISWKAVAKKGLRLSGNGSDIWVRVTEGKDVLWARETLGNHVVQLVEESAHFTYEEWHQALGHTSVSSINAKSYIDQHLIPTPPKNFHCDVSSLSKSVHHRPAESSGHSKATCAFELIHTDMSGKFSVLSIGKRNYYITFIDDYTHATPPPCSSRRNLTQLLQSRPREENRRKQPGPNIPPIHSIHVLSRTSNSSERHPYINLVIRKEIDVAALILTPFSSMFAPPQAFHCHSQSFFVFVALLFLNR